MSSYQFLSLAPTTSAGYPSSPTSNSVSKEVASDSHIPIVTELDLIDAFKTSRSSSSSSTASTKKARFLKLCPVHFGEGDGDWSEEVVSE